jgi:hypothetical protein
MRIFQNGVKHLISKLIVIIINKIIISIKHIENIKRIKMNIEK